MHTVFQKIGLVRSTYLGPTLSKWLLLTASCTEHGTLDHWDASSTNHLCLQVCLRRNTQLHAAIVLLQDFMERIYVLTSKPTKRAVSCIVLSSFVWDRPRWTRSGHAKKHLQTTSRYHITINRMRDLSKPTHPNCFGRASSHGRRLRMFLGRIWTSVNLRLRFCMAGLKLLNWDGTSWRKRYLPSWPHWTA